jgi:hypothetical protein
MNSSGPISLAGTTAGVSIQIENGGNGTTQISLNDAPVRSLAGVPSGAITMPTNFYGKANQFNYIISTNTANVNVATNATAAGWNGSSALVCTINSGVVVYSASTGSYAMTVNGSFPGGLSIINNGTILGKGGAGGYSGSVGLSGGPALLVQSNVSITNGSGRISGGGGGGGGGDAYTYCTNWDPECPCCVGFYETSYGGGGGGGIGNGAGGGGGTQNGSAGTLTAAGGGGTCSPNCYYVGIGGTGGSYGASGGAGTCGCPPSYFPYGPAGGAAGACLVGNSYITWVSTGTRNGTIS